ncbi:MAG: nucleotide sugar dehydrogenase [Alphaproteobacteria bacterium]|nr:nucleotide sugar dehydrogenase [Alphaproteobacteria bacterium]
MPLNSPQKVSVIGLGYVGLPLAVALAEHFNVLGLDIDHGRTEELAEGHDRTGEVTPDSLKKSRCTYTSEAADLANSDIFIVAVPTPVDDEKVPDLGPLRGACESVGPHVTGGSVVVFESTVFPGATEDICGPILERLSGLVCGKDFFLGYSPERMNPGDTEHTVANIVKVVAGQTPEVSDLLENVYGRITKAGVFMARDIQTAEAAKVIENAQRDINIAFINEATQIFHKLGLSMYDVLEAANTKWNFLNFQPGLVGGHCIGVDPYYLAYRAAQIGHDPDVLLAGRRTNDGMGAWIAQQITTALGGPARVLVLGLTFKENVPDLRNSGAYGLIKALEKLGNDVVVHDACADPAEAKAIYGVELIPDISGSDFACVVGAVAHDVYKDLSADALTALMKSGGILADIKGIWRAKSFDPNIRRWDL